MNFMLCFLKVLTFCVLAESQYRLPTTITPKRYAIKLKLSPEEETFIGKVSIYITIFESVDSIKLHCNNLTIDNIFLDDKKISDYSDAKNEYQLIEIWDTNKSSILPGNYVIKINYHGTFSKPSHGLFKTGVTYENKTLSHLVATDFEPCYARTVFPCFDEPFFKATFQLSLVLPDDSYQPLSNMNLHESFNTSEGVLYKFNTTFPMSTYLLAFAVHQLPFGEHIGYKKTPIRIYSINASNENSQKLLKYVDESLEFYTNYTSYSYPLPKIDMIEYDRFGNVATENWGLITTITGLLSPENEIFDDYQKFAVITHEIAHFWFGDLVTNRWWDDIWLNEGITSYISLKASDTIKKDNSSLNFGLQMLENLYYLDITGNCNPVVNYEEQPLKIVENFNDAAYVKGATVMRMVELALGEKKFHNAIIDYVKTFAFKTADTNDFINIFEKYTEKKAEFRRFVKSYLYQKEYPVLNVTETDTEYILQQTRPDKSNSSVSRFEYKWTIPLTYITDLSKEPQLIWFDKDMENLTIHKHKEKWIKFNYKQIGFYRTNYSTSLWKKFFKYNHELESHERDHLLLEAAAMWDANQISCDIFLMYIQSMGKKINISYILQSMTRLKLKSLDLETYDLVLKFLRKIFTDIERPKAAKWMHEQILRNNLTTEAIQENHCSRWIKKHLLDY